MLSYSKQRAKNNESNVSRFHREIQEVLYGRSVILFVEQKYTDVEEDFFYFARINSFDSRQYIRRTFDNKLKKQKSQALCNKLQLFEFPHKIASLRKPEKFIISKRLLLKKIVIMPNAQPPKLKDAIFNVPLQADNVCNILSRDADSIYRGHVYFEAVRSDVAKEVLHYLKRSSKFYQDILIDEEQISGELLSLEDDQNDTPTAVNDHEEQENTLDDCMVGANKTDLISVVPSEIDNECITIAPCQGKKPMSLLTDINCEELAHAYLFPSRKFGYKVQRNINLTTSEYFNQRLLNYKQRF